jgi:ABC-type dipeptide/oligopeptide/nickel transport system permease component
VVIIEIIFGIGGLGQVLLEATLDRDLFVILGLTVYTVGVYVILNAIVDLVMFMADPRTRR